MARRPARPVIPAQIRESIGRDQHKSLGRITPLRRPASAPVEAYTMLRRTPITGGNGSAIVANDGTAAVQVGPQGLGTVWYPDMASIATTTGALDNSTCQLFLGPVGLQPLISGQSYAGGGDTFGLAVPPVWPGYFIVAVWSGGNPGDLATLTVYGTQQATGMGQ